MITRTCDRCHKNTEYDARTIRCDGYALYLKGEKLREIAVTELDLCRECKDEFGQIIKKFVEHTL